MNKIKLNPKAKLIFIILGVVVLIVILENAIRILPGVISDKVAEIKEEKRIEEYQETPQYEEEKQIVACIENAINLLNSGDYETLYNLLDPDYKACMQIDSVEKTKELFDKYGFGANKIRLIKYVLVYGRYNCQVEFISESMSVIKTIFVTPTKSEDFYIIPDDIWRIEKYKNKFYHAGQIFEYTVPYKLVRGTSDLYVVDIKNLSNKDYTGSLDTTCISKSDSINRYPKNPEELKEISIKAKDKIRIFIEIDTSSEVPVKFEDKSIEINYVINNGSETISDSIDIADHYWD